MDKERAIDRYKILRSLGIGGMGEVFLVYDPFCEREVALKKVKEELKANPTIKERFLREAKIASQLSHPSIIPIYTISPNQEEPFYTMPYVEGETLKQILKVTREQEKAGEILHPIGSSIPALSLIFLHVCQAIAYTHSKGILHRDVKPENIIIGKYGEVLILDWGIAEYFNKNKPLQIGKKKIPGTLTYMPPERALGVDDSPSTDIYALGVILYQILTLRLPFPRTNLADFRKAMKHERLIDPSEMAPYRDIPLQLADIVKKCLSPLQSERFQTVEDLIFELNNYIEGKPEWIMAAALDVDRLALSRKYLACQTHRYHKSR
jgi:serine/threonine protein kinase